MATQTTTTVIDDLTGEQGAETITFGIDGSLYELDLTAANQDKLRSSLAEYVQAGRKVTGKASSIRATSNNGSAPTKRDPEQTKAIRAWARANGYDMSDRGRIPTQVEIAYNANDPSLLRIGAASLASVG